MSKNDQKISILVVDDSPMCLRFIQEVVEKAPALHVTATAKTGDQAFSLAYREKPWVILIDLGMQIFANPQAILYLRSRSPASTIIGLSLLEDHLPDRVLKKFGLDAVVHKSHLSTELVPKILEQVSWIGVVRARPSLAFDPGRVCFSWLSLLRSQLEIPLMTSN